MMAKEWGCYPLMVKGMGSRIVKSIIMRDVSQLNGEVGRSDTA